MFEEIGPQYMQVGLKIFNFCSNYAMKIRLEREININQKRIEKLEEKLEIDSKDYEFEKIKEYNLKQELESKLNLDIIDSGKVWAGEYFRFEYLGKRLQICFGELKIDKNANLNETDNSLIFTFEYPVPYKEIYFVFPNDPKSKAKNINKFNFDVEIKFDNEQDLKEFKENKEIELNKINYFSFGEWG